MPNITQYEAPQGLTIRPTSAAEESLVQAGRMYRTFGEEAGARFRQSGEEIGSLVKTYGNYVEHNDATDVMQKMSVAANQVHDQWTDYMKTPGLDMNDPDIKQKFVDKIYAPMMDGIKNGIHTETGMALYNQHKAELDQHFNNLFNSDMAGVSAIKADQAMTDTLHNWGALVDKDPTALPTLMAQVSPYVDQMLKTSPNVSAEQAAKMAGPMKDRIQQKLEEGALFSTMNRSASAARQLLDSGTFTHLDPVMADNAVKQAQRMEQMQASQGRAEARAAAEDRNERQAGAWMSRMTPYLQSGQPIPKEFISQIMKDAVGAGGNGALKYSTALHLMDLVNSEKLKPENMIQTSPQVKQDVQNRLLLDDGDANKIRMPDLLDLKYKNQISPEDFKGFAQDLSMIERDPAMRADLKTFDQATKSFEPYINPGNGLRGQMNPQTSMLYDQFLTEKKADFIRFRKGGVSTNDLLYNPKSVNYLFKDVDRFMGGGPSQQAVGLKQMMEDRLNQSQTGRNNNLAQSPIKFHTEPPSIADLPPGLRALIPSNKKE